MRELAIQVQYGADPTADEEGGEQYGRLAKEEDEWTQDGDDAGEGGGDEGEEPAGVGTAGVGTEAESEEEEKE